jgi:hypothetical protein
MTKSLADKAKTKTKIELTDKIRVLEAMFDTTNLPLTAKEFFYQIVKTYNAKEDRCYFHNHKQFAEKLGVTRWAILRNEKKLEADGWITIKRRKRNCNEYFINWNHEAVKASTKVRKRQAKVDVTPESHHSHIVDVTPQPRLCDSPALVDVTLESHRHNDSDPLTKTQETFFPEDKAKEVWAISIQEPIDKGPANLLSEPDKEVSADFLSQTNNQVAGLTSEDTTPPTPKLRVDPLPQTTYANFVEVFQQMLPQDRKPSEKVWKEAHAEYDRNIAEGIDINLCLRLYRQELDKDASFNKKFIKNPDKWLLDKEWKSYLTRRGIIRDIRDAIIILKNLYALVEGNTGSGSYPSDNPKMDEICVRQLQQYKEAMLGQEEPEEHTFLIENIQRMMIGEQPIEPEKPRKPPTPVPYWLQENELNAALARKNKMLEERI